MINVLDARGPYRQVLQQIWGTISRHLPDDAWQLEQRDYLPGALNFSLFINLDSDVLMSHGVADKNYMWRIGPDGVRSLMSEHRTDVLVPGRMLRDRIVASPDLGLDADHVHPVGWPRLDLLLAADRRARRVRRVRRVVRRRPRVLWAPTHDYVKSPQDQVPLSSYPAFLPYVDQLARYADVVVSEHPRNRQKGDSRRPTTQLLLEADVVISDFGTMVYEAWALGKPVVFPYWLIGDRLARRHRGAAENVIYTDRIGRHADSFEELVSMVLAPPAPDPALDRFLDDYLDPRFTGTSGKHVADLLLRLDAERNGA